MKHHVPNFAHMPPEHQTTAALFWLENYERVRSVNRMLSKIVLVLAIVAITLFVFWQQDRNSFKYTCRVMTDSELHLPDDVDIGSEAENSITRAMNGARIEAQC